MTGDIAVRVERLGKWFQVGETVRHDMLRESLMEALRAPYRFVRERLSGERRARRREAERFWALRDIDFEIERGSVVGVIGRNGAGKSTLLKILSRITEPSEGRAELRGRVGSLLEVGTGFHDELTGRENVYLSGAVLGMLKREIDESFDEIVSFAGVEKFIDTPVKRYSSGMRVRLGFAVAAFLRPEILIVDEVLAVGDAQFRKRSMGKMDDLARSGRTVLFVSHNLPAIAQLTDRAIVLHEGKKVYDGATDGAIARYLELADDGTTVFSRDPIPGRPAITKLWLKTSRPSNVQYCLDPMEICLEVTTPRAMQNPDVVVVILDELGRRIVTLWMLSRDRPWGRQAGVHGITVRLPKLRLYKGRYVIDARLFEDGVQLEHLQSIVHFEVTMGDLDRGLPWWNRMAVYLEDYKWELRNSQINRVSTRRPAG